MDHAECSTAGALANLDQPPMPATAGHKASVNVVAVSGNAAARSRVGHRIFTLASGAADIRQSTAANVFQRRELEFLCDHGYHVLPPRLDQKHLPLDERNLQPLGLRYKFHYCCRQ